MGNSGSVEVTLDKDADDFVSTGDGIKLSPALIERLSGNEPDPTPAYHDDLQSLKEAKKVAEETQKILDSRERQLTELGEKWKADLEKHQKLNELSIDEFEKTAKQFEGKFRKQNFEPICGHLLETLVDCYKTNPGHVLECSEQAAEFKKCVYKAKQSLNNRTNN